MNMHSQHVSTRLFSAVGALLALAAVGGTVVDFSQPAWKMDFGKFTEPEDADGTDEG